MTLSRLKQPTSSGAQLRMFAKTEMPAPPLEKDIVYETKRVLEKMGYKVWSGRIRIFDRPLDGTNGAPFIPVFGPGTPDLLGIFPALSPAHGRLWGLEAKRDLSEKERESQRKWRTEAAAMRVPVLTFSSTDHAVRFLEEHRHLGPEQR